ncbi:MAG TPA: hypothetical protein VLJ76_03135 [Gaiellaceae bacterium]|nr:hypothetical protein [Gaiellaceae bacterium]
MSTQRTDEEQRDLQSRHRRGARDPGCRCGGRSDNPGAAAAGQQAKIYVLATLAGATHKGALYVLDATGRRSLLTDFGSIPLPGRKKEPDGAEVESLAVEQDGTLLVVDQAAGGQGELFAVDPNTGARRVLTDFAAKRQGPVGRNPLDVATMPDGRILVAVANAGAGRCQFGSCGALFTVDPGTGRRAILSDFGDASQGPVENITGGLAVDSFGRVYVAVTATTSAVVEVDATTGLRSVVATRGSGGIIALAAQADGSLLATGCCTDLLGIDPASHQVTTLSNLEDPALGPCYCPGAGNSVALVTATAGPTLIEGTVLLSSHIGSVLAVDRSTWRRTALSDFTNPAQGPTIDPMKSVLAGIVFVPGAAPPPPPPPTGTILTFAGAFGHPSLYAVDPATGKRTALSDMSDASQGPTLSTWRLASDFGKVVATGLSTTVQDDGLLVQIDPATGKRTIVSDFENAAQGPIGYTPFGVFVLASNTFLVTDRGQGGGGGNGAALWSVENGVRTKVTDFDNPSQGPLGRSPEGVAIDGSGQMWVVDAEAGTDCTGFGDHCGGLFRVAQNGQRTLVSDFGNPAQGPLGDDPVGLVLDADGSFLVIDQFAGACGCGELFRVDATTGQRTLLSDFGNAAQGPTGGRNPSAVAIATDGSILTDGCPGASGNGAICRIDRLTGNRTNFGDFGDPALGPVVIGPMGTLAVYH